MMIPRVALAAVAALSTAMVSIDPAVIAGAHEDLPARPARPEIRAPEDRSSGEAPAAPASSALAPGDVRVEVTREGHGHRVVVLRPGHLVALQYGPARAAGKDWAAVHVEVATRGSRRKAGDPDRGALAPLVWETTPLGALTTARGLVSLRQDGAELQAELSLSAPPTQAGTASGAHHTCAAHRDPGGGFTVLCRLHHGARRVSAASVTGPRAEDNAWVIHEKEPLVRLDLPLFPGMAEARVVGFVHGLTGAVLRAEASWTEGEKPTLVIEETERDQPVSSDFSWR